MHTNAAHTPHTAHARHTTRTRARTSRKRRTHTTHARTQHTHAWPLPALWLQGFTDGVLEVGPYAGRKVSEAKPLIREEMVAAGQAIMYSEPERQVGARGRAWMRVSEHV